MSPVNRDVDPVVSGEFDSYLRCDCDTNARPEVRASEVFMSRHVPAYYYVKCDLCDAIGEAGFPAKEAIALWQKGERFSE